jgi:GDP-4-dehydro-6-deoxy-D-mannose reductase
MEKGVAGEAYNVCSGRAIAVADVVRMALDFGEKSIDCLIDHNLERPTDLPLLLGDNMKLRNATGWCPHISLEMSVDDALEYARANV